MYILHIGFRLKERNNEINTECVNICHITPTRYVEASLEDLVHGLGVIVVMSQQLGAVAHHGPTAATLMLKRRERETKKLCKSPSQLSL